MNGQIAIIGDGAMGTVSAIILAENGLPVVLWSAFPQAAEQLQRTRENKRFLPGHLIPENIRISADASSVFADVDLAVSAVPTQFMRSIWRRLGPHCRPDLPICSVAKGIENGTLLRPTQIISDVLGAADGPVRPVAALSGPSIAPELARKLPATVTVASRDAGFAERVQKLFTRPYFRVYTNADLIGVETAGRPKTSWLSPQAYWTACLRATTRRLRS